MTRRTPSLIVKLPLNLKLDAERPPAASKPTPPTTTTQPRLPVTSNLLDYVTQSQLVLAIAIQKSRPRDVSTKEYCEQLRRQIKDDQRAVPDQLRHIDTCEFWKDQYTRLYAEKKLVEDKLLYAEESARLLRDSIKLHAVPMRVEGGRSLSPAQSTPSKKRSSPTPEEELCEDSATHVPPPLSDDKSLRLSNYIVQLKRQRYHLEEACKSPDTLDQINNLMKHTTQMLALIDTPLYDCCLPFRFLKTNTRDKHALDLLQRVLHHIRLSFLASFRAFNELCRTIPGRSKKPKLIFELVMFFGKTLDFLQTIGIQQAAEQEESRLHGMRSSKRVRDEEGEYAINKYFTRTLSSLAYGLEWSVHQSSHCELLEGILFCILEHTGRLVSKAIFLEHVATSDNPGNISKTNTPASKPVAQFEARYIVQVLHAALGGSEKKDLVTKILAAGKTNTRDFKHASNHSTVLSGDLLLKARKLLQSTLMKSTVGGEDLEALRLPTPPAERTDFEIPEASRIEPYGSDWLVEMVWTLIGWDLVG